MSRARRFAATAIAALFALQIYWHGVILPSVDTPRWAVVALFCLPLLPSVLLLLARRPSAQFWGGVAALLYFCHGVTEAWTSPPARALALVELALSVAIIIAGSWDAIAARRAKQRAAATNV